ncbi:MAG: hypothetical protein J5556_06125, partial [Deltaproteobacteria bacterium]|nr:hypothetical protein [Deltaproteobacteria bacterium]
EGFKEPCFVGAHLCVRPCFVRRVAIMGDHFSSEAVKSIGSPLLLASRRGTAREQLLGNILLKYQAFRCAFFKA